jgi:hypothetical protein
LRKNSFSGLNPGNSGNFEKPIVFLDAPRRDESIDVWFMGAPDYRNRDMNFLNETPSLLYIYNLPPFDRIKDIAQTFA